MGLSFFPESLRLFAWNAGMDDHKPARHRLCRLVGIRTDGTRLVLGEGFAIGDAHWRRSAIDEARIFAHVEVEEYFPVDVNDHRPAPP